MGKQSTLHKMALFYQPQPPAATSHVVLSTGVCEPRGSVCESWAGGSTSGCEVGRARLSLAQVFPSNRRETACSSPNEMSAYKRDRSRGLAVG